MDMGKVKKEEKFLLKLARLSPRETQKESLSEAQTRRVISNLAYFWVLLQDVKQDVAENGWQDEYQNGENQGGTKQSPAMKTLNDVQKQYNYLQRQLQVISKDSGIETDDLMDFLKET